VSTKSKHIPSIRAMLVIKATSSGISFTVKPQTTYCGRQTCWSLTAVAPSRRAATS